MWTLLTSTKSSLKGNPALAKVGLGKEDIISPRALFFAAIESKFYIHNLHNPPEVL